MTKNYNKTITKEKIDPSEVNRSVNYLQKGKIVLVPTDTVWGIACDAINFAAVQEIYRIKNRPSHKPFVLLVSSIEMLKRYILHLHPRIETLLQYHNKPITIVYPKAKNLPQNVIGQDGSVAIRIPKDEFTQQLINGLDNPIVATSANMSGLSSPCFFGEINSDVIQAVDYVVRYRHSDKTPKNPSVIAKLNERDELVFLRE